VQIGGWETLGLGAAMMLLILFAMIALAERNIQADTRPSAT
jgi:hypothetical protein